MAKKKREETPKIAIVVGKAIARQRKLAALTQLKVAEEIGTGVETISRLESGAILQTVDRLQQLSIALNCPITSFFWEQEGDAAAQAEIIIDMLQTLNTKQRESVVRCVAELVRALNLQST